MNKVQVEGVKLEKTTEDLLDLRWSFGREIERQIERGDVQRDDVGFGTGSVLGSLLNIRNRLSSESSTRKVMREKVAPDISKLFEGIDVLARDIKQKKVNRFFASLKTWIRLTLTKQKKFFTKILSR